MNYCPSQGLENYIASQEMPESCPVCGKENCTEDGEWTCPEAPGFCSKECQKQLLDEQTQIANEMVEELLEEERLIKAHNSKCPSCKFSSKFCFCPTNPEN